MPRPKSVVPTYRRHKQSGKAIVTVRTAGGRRQDMILGDYGSAASKAEYRRLCALIDVNDGAMPGRGDGLTINEILVPFIRFVDNHYRRPDGTKTAETALQAIEAEWPGGRRETGAAAMIRQVRAAAAFRWSWTNWRTRLRRQ